MPKFSEENWPKIQALTNKIKEVGEKHNATAAQVTLAWLAAQGDDIISIPGTSTIKYLEANCGAIDVKLSDAEVKSLRDFAEGTELPGGRYPEG